MKVSKAQERACLALAGGKPVRKMRKPTPKLAAGWAIELVLPCTVVSEMNRRDFWAVRKRRFDSQAMTLGAVLREAGLVSSYRPKWVTSLPVAVTWTHVGRTMDTDNLASAFKGLRDELAEFLGCDDGDEANVTWEYRQENAVGGVGGVRVRVEGRNT